MTNLTFYCELTDPYSLYGLYHFAKKYNLINTNNPYQADVNISYSGYEGNNAAIQILLNQEASDGECIIVLDNKNIPLFKEPVEQTCGNLLWTVQSENKAYPCLSIINNRITIGFNIFREIGLILSGYYEEIFCKNDTMGKTLKTIPVVDVLEEAVVSLINQIVSEQMQLSVKWPDGHRFALVLTHDVDRIYKTYQYLPSIWNSIKRANLSEFEYHFKNMLFRHGMKNPYWTFEDICTIENSLGIKSAYYFLNEKSKLNPFSLQSWILFRGLYNIESISIQDAIRKLHNTGFEIGVHGSYNSYNNLELLQSEKHILESIIGKTVKGIRQHYLNYDISKTPTLHNKCGFSYDTTIGFKPVDGIGFRRGTCFPFYIMLSDLSISKLLELPLIIMDVALNRNISVTLGDCFEIIEEVEKYQGVLTILWHTQMFNKREYPDMIDIYKEIVEIAKGKGAWIATPKEVFEWLTR
jgi:hypothetical protein